MDMTPPMLEPCYLSKRAQIPIHGNKPGARCTVPAVSVAVLVVAVLVSAGRSRLVHPVAAAMPAAARPAACMNPRRDGVRCITVQSRITLSVMRNGQQADRSIVLQHDGAATRIAPVSQSR